MAANTDYSTGHTLHKDGILMASKKLKDEQAFISRQVSEIHKTVNQIRGLRETLRNQVSVLSDMLDGVEDLVERTEKNVQAITEVIAELTDTMDEGQEEDKVNGAT